MPFSLGKTLLIECSESYEIKGTFSPELSSRSTILMVIIFALNFWVWITTSGSFMFTATHFSFVECCCFTQYIRGFKTKCQDSKSINEDLQLSHLWRIYHQIQLLVQFYNDIQQNVPTMSFFALIRNGVNLPIMEMALFCSVGFAGFVAIVVIFSAYGRLHQESYDLVEYLKTRFMCENIYARTGGIKLTKRFVISLRPVKVKLGQVNYVDQMTPIVMIDICFSQLANLLLCT